MFCQHCDNFIEEESLNVRESDHDNDIAEVYMDCPECEKRNYCFISSSDFTVQED